MRQLEIFHPSSDPPAVEDGNRFGADKTGSEETKTKTKIVATTVRPAGRPLQN